MSINTESVIIGLNTIFNNELKNILDNISNEYNLDKKKLYEKYLNNDVSKSEIKIELKKKKRKKNVKLCKNELCMARKADGLQCTRRRKDSLEFCGKHNKNLKFGRIDDKTKYSDNSEFLKTKEIKIDGKNYLINDKNVVFNYDIDNPMIIGKLSSEGKIITIDEMNLGI
tara:strand:+ start:33 stop:542 length:510 start_codon:yes stop_codon:yes gene_type:complete